MGGTNDFRKPCSGHPFLSEVTVSSLGRTRSVIGILSSPFHLASEIVRCPTNYFTFSVRPSVIYGVKFEDLFKLYPRLSRTKGQERQMTSGNRARSPSSVVTVS